MTIKLDGKWSSFHQPAPNDPTQLGHVQALAQQCSACVRRPLEIEAEITTCLVAHVLPPGWILFLVEDAAHGSFVASGAHVE